MPQLKGHPPLSSPVRRLLLAGVVGTTLTLTAAGSAIAIVSAYDARQTYPDTAALAFALPSGQTARCGVSLGSPQWTWLARTICAGVLVTGRQVYLHPDWMWAEPTGRPVSDLALVELTKPVRASIVPIAFGQLGTGSHVRLVGWGLTQFPPPSTPGLPLPVILQEYDTTRLPDSMCAGGFIGAGDICVNGNGAGACYGDSGSPSLRRSALGWVSIGIASRETTTEPACGIPGVYTDPTYFRAWMIAKILKPRIDPCTCPPTLKSADSTRMHLFKPLITT
jgi:hypothetical protein